jgi:hypothetical protein
MDKIQSLAPLPQQTLDGWHAFVATGNPDLLAPLLAEHMVFRSPFLQSRAPMMPRWNSAPISENGSSRASI